MSEKRRDAKGRILRNGESQRSDGMYMYRYNDAQGVRRTVYSWRLVKTDKLPPGKKSGEPLRDLEDKLARDVEDGIETFTAAKKTLNELFEEYMGIKQELKIKTKAHYVDLYNIYIKGELGSRSIVSFKYSDIKKFYLSLYYEKKLKPGSIFVIDKILHPTFTLAVRDGYIRSNPVHQVYAELKKQNGWVQEKRHALTIEQQKAFMGYIRSSPRYSLFLPFFTVLLGTGCRVGEAIGLRWEDCDFAENLIFINHNMVFCKPVGEEKRRFIISTPKTAAGKRVIPMLQDVKDALLNELLRQKENGFNQQVVDGYSGFIFQNRVGQMLSDNYVNKIILSIIQSYNAEEIKTAKQQNREPALLPRFSAHILRHTFCTRFCENETNLKVIQEIMGHADISTTMDIYNEATLEKKKESFANLEGKIVIG